MDNEGELRLARIEEEIDRWENKDLVNAREHTKDLVNAREQAKDFRGLVSAIRKIIAGD